MLGAALIGQLTTGFSQNININPQEGQLITNYPMTVALADSGAVGTNQTWDFSAFIYDNNNPEEFLVRLPAQNELNDFPMATIAVESTVDGSVDYYHASTDSLATLGSSGDNGMAIYSNPLIEMKYPLSDGVVYHDTSVYSYLSGSTPVTVTQFRKWQLTGSGTLITPTETWNGVSKVSTIDSMIFMVDGSVYATVLAYSFNWYNETENTALARIMYDDYYDETKGVFLFNSGFATVDQLSDVTRKVFPNPAKDQVTIEGHFDRYELISPEGTIVLTGSESTVSLTSLSAGIYFLRIFNGDEMNQQKLVKID